MKALKLLIATFLIVCTVKGQDLTVTQVSHENVWSLTVPQWVAPGYDYELTFSKDSFELDNKWYRKELRKIGVNGTWEATKDCYREENNSVFRKRANQKERLAYNYAAAVGDTLRSGPNERGMVVTKIETITTNDGKERKKLTLLNLCFGDHYVTWIEGIGELSMLDDLTLGCIIYDPVPQFNCM